MKLKSKITKAEYDVLADVLKECYTERSGEYFLDSDDAAELRRAKERADEEKRAEKERADRLQAAIDQAEAARRASEEEAARKKGDLAAIEASWQQKLDAAVAEANAKAEKLRTNLERLLVDNVAQSIASEISTSPTLILPHIRARLSASYDEDNVNTRVLDATGKPSALTLAELKAEFVANKDFSAIIKASNASGGGAAGNAAGGGAAKKISEMTEAERVAFAKSNREAFQRQAVAEGLPSVGF